METPQKRGVSIRWPTVNGWHVRCLSVTSCSTLKVQGGDEFICSWKRGEPTMLGLDQPTSVRIPESERGLVGVSTDGHVTFTPPESVACKVGDKENRDQEGADEARGGEEGCTGFESSS